MSEQRTGKATAELFEQVILRRLGASDPDVLVGPRHGVDVGVVRVADGVAMALTADPVFVVPAYGWERASWFAVHILASDASTSGLPLRWMSVDLNLPPAISDEDLAALWDGFHRACEGLGIAVVTGHTARYDGCEWPMVGGATCLALGSADAYVTPTMARPGDAVVVTKGAAIEATALFAATFPDRLTAGPGRRDGACGGRALRVDDRRAGGGDRAGVRTPRRWRHVDARRHGGRGARRAPRGGDGVGRRDPRGPRPDPGAPEVRAVCDHVGIDPYTSISEGTLIATVVAERADAYVAALAAEGIEAAVVGEILPSSAGRTIVRDGREEPLRHPGLDPFWGAFGAWAADAAAGAAST